MTNTNDGAHLLPRWVRLLPVLLLAACTESDIPALPDVAEQATPRPGENTIDLIIEGEFVVTMDENDTVIGDGAIAIDNGIILAIDTSADINDRYTAANHLRGNDRIVMPGLINGHSHAAMTLLRGIADDLDLMDWLQNYIFPAEVEFVDEELLLCDISEWLEVENDEDDELKIETDVSFPLEVQERSSIADQIAKLRNLVADGTLTQEEFEAAKARVLS